MAETLRVKELKSVFTPEQIAVRVRELGVEIDGLYGTRPRLCRGRSFGQYGPARVPSHGGPDP